MKKNLHDAVAKQSPEMVRSFLDSSADIEVLDFWGKTPLAEAVRTIQPEIVQIFLYAKANIEARDEKGWTPFFWAACASRHNDPRVLEIAQKLFDAGSAVNILDKDGHSPFVEAMRVGSLDFLRFFLAARPDVDVNVRDKWGRYPLMWAVRCPAEAERVQLCIDAGADIYAQDNEGWTAFEWAERCANEKAIQMLHDAGAQA